jgi:short-subunit dehydrogenase
MIKPAKTILITGATAGIGRTTALHLARRGHRVIASGRKPGELAKLVAEARGSIDAACGSIATVVLDVTSPPSIAAAVTEVDRLTDGRGIDVLVNNAGFGVLGPMSEIPESEIRRQYETNVFGLMNVTHAFLPRMMERRSGRIINISSVGGQLTLPFFGVYNSTKYAVESMSDAMRYELRPFGVDVVLIEPGIIRTNFEATAVGNLEQFKSGPYRVAIDKYEQMSKMADRFASNPIVIAKAIARAVKARRPWARYVAPRSNALMIFLSAILPTRIWDWAMRKMTHLHAKTLVDPPASRKTPPRSSSTPTEVRAPN